MKYVLAGLICLLCVSVNAQEFREYTDLVYAPDSLLENPELQALNLVVPDTENPPLFIWIGGGAWSYVDRHGEMDLARQFAKQGIAVASLGHRLSSATWKDPGLVSTNRHPDHIRDIAAAVNWLANHAEEYEYDRDRLFIGGYSSGAQLAALLCLDPSYLNQYGLAPDIFSGLIPVAGAYDIVRYHEAFENSDRPELAELHVEAVFGTDEVDWINASPVTFADNHTVPMFLISESGTYDYTLLMEEKMGGKENFQARHYRDLTHAGLWKDLSHNPESECRNRIVGFIKEHAGNPMIDQVK